MIRTLVWLAALMTGTAFAATVTLPGGTLTVPGTSTTGVSFVYSGTLTQNDTIALTQAGNPCLQTAAYCTNGAGVVTVAGSTGVGGTSTFSGPSGGVPAGTWHFGALLMTISGVGAVQVFPTNAANGLGSATPPASLSLSSTTLGSLGFGTFSQVNPTITFIVADNNFGDNSGQFVLTQPAAPPPVNTAIPTLGEWGLIVLAVLLGAAGIGRLRRRTA